MIKATQYRKKYNTGGNIGAGIGSAATSLIPGVGPVLAPLGGLVGGKIGSLFDNNKPKREKVMNHATQGYKYGGKYKRHLKYQTGGNLSAAQPIGPDAVRYDGPSHEQGGIPIDQAGNPTDPSNAMAEVEGDETRQGDFIFSDELMVPGENISFAEMHEMLLKQGVGEEEIQQLAQMQEQVKQEQGIPSEMGAQGGEEMMMGDGGNIPKYPMGGELPDPYGEQLQMGENISSIPTASTTPTASRGSTALKAAQSFAPSLTRAGIAAFAPNPKKTRAARTPKVSTQNPAFTAARGRLASGFRANPTQASYAQYIQGTNQLTASQAQDTLQRENINSRMQMQTDGFNISNEARDADMKAQSTAKRLSLLDDAVQAPLTAGVADKAGQRNLIADILTSADQVDPSDWGRTVEARLRAVGIPEDRIKEILASYMKYGGKLKK